jgi:hypothetical protein
VGKPRMMKRKTRTTMIETGRTMISKETDLGVVE